MPVLRKPKLKISRNGEQQRQKVFDNGTGFVFSDDINKWMHGKSNVTKKCKPKF